MRERYPVYRSGEACCYVRTIPDFLETYDGRASKYYFWRGREGRGYRGPLLKTFWEAPHTPPLVPRVDVEGRLSVVAERYGERLRGKTVMADFSGGKDSTASLVLLSRLRRLVDFKLVAVYVHMPYLEPPSNIDFVERAAERLGVELLVVEADRRRLLYYLETRGLPHRGSRWCTYLKTRALRAAKKAVEADYEAKAERMNEAGKRMRRLGEMKRKDTFLEGPTLNIVYDMEVLDVAGIVASEGLVHPDYLDGVPRVSCKYCPYRSLYELYAHRTEVEDEGLILDVARREWWRLYSPRLEWDAFWGRHLWRFTPSLATMIAREDPEGGDMVGLDEAREMFRSMWLHAGLYSTGKPDGIFSGAPATTRDG